MRMGFRNHVLRSVLLLALALALGIGVAVLSGGERTPAVQGSALPTLEQRADQRMVKPPIRLAPGSSCATSGGCARL